MDFRELVDTKEPSGKIKERMVEAYRHNPDFRPVLAALGDHVPAAEPSTLVSTELEGAGKVPAAGAGRIPS